MTAVIDQNRVRWATRQVRNDLPVYAHGHELPFDAATVVSITSDILIALGTNDASVLSQELQDKRRAAIKGNKGCGYSEFVAALFSI